MVLKTAGEQKCLIALFLGKINIALKKCKRLFLNESFEPVWIKSPDFSCWIYILGNPQQVTVQCQKVGFSQASKSSHQMMLEGTGVLPNSSFCYIHAENFKLLPHSLGETTVDFNKIHIELPSIESILNFSEKNLLQPVVMQPAEWQ
jgi:hypothetical protein